MIQPMKIKKIRMIVVMLKIKEISIFTLNGCVLNVLATLIMCRQTAFYTSMSHCDNDQAE